jgi:cold shock CspA family protein
MSFKRHCPQTPKQKQNDAPTYERLSPNFAARTASCRYHREFCAFPAVHNPDRLQMFCTQPAFNRRVGKKYAPSRGADIFVHVRGCDDSIAGLKIGQRVRFEERTSKHSGKQEAFAVTLL